MDEYHATGEVKSAIKGTVKCYKMIISCLESSSIQSLKYSVAG